jgi:hypothetical protein
LRPHAGGIAAPAVTSPVSGAGGNGLFGAGAAMGISGASPNGFLRLAGWSGLGMLCMRVGCGCEWVVTHAGLHQSPTTRLASYARRLGLRR